MIRLDATTRKLQIVLAGAVTTNQLAVMVSYSDKTSTTYNGGTQLATTNDTTPVDICAAPAASTIRDIDNVNIRNTDTAAATVTVLYDNNGTDSEIVEFDLAVGDQAVYVHGAGWQVIDYSGALKTAGGGGGAGSVTSQEMSVADAALSNRITSVANNVSALSNALSVLSQTNSVDHAGLSNRITSVAGLAGGSVTSAELVQGLSLVSVAARSAVDTVSNAVSALSVAHQSLVDRVSANSGTGGGGSVTSAELVQGLSLVSVAAQSAVNTVSAAAADALSVANAASQKGSVLSVNLASVDARVTSVGNAVSVVSQALSALSQANSAAHVSIDGRVTSVANAVSVLSQALSALSNANSAAHVSIDGRVTSVANAVSVVSQALSVLSQTNSVDHAALSNRITSVAGLAGGGSVTSTELSAAIAGQSVRTDSVANAVSVVSQALSVLSVAHQSLVDRVSANSGTGGAGSVTSAELVQGLSLVSVAAASADATLSVRIDSAFGATSNYASVASAAAVAAQSAANTASNYASVASNAASVAVQAASTASVAAAALNYQIRKVANVQSTAGSALVDISALVLTVAAGDNLEIEGFVYLSTSAATVGLRMGWSVPPLSTPRMGFFTRYSAGQSAGIAGGGGLLQVSGQSILMSITGTPGAGTPYIVKVEAQMNVASAGTIRLMYAGIASTAASPQHIMPGSYLKAIKI